MGGRKRMRLFSPMRKPVCCFVGTTWGKLLSWAAQPIFLVPAQTNKKLGKKKSGSLRYLNRFHFGLRTPCIKISPARGGTGGSL